MQILVTGGAGFIGSHLVTLLVETGRRVRVFERHGADVRHLPDQIELVRGDVRNRQAVREAVRGCEEVTESNSDRRHCLSTRR